MNVNGNIMWQKTLGGNYGDYMTSVQETHDGGYIVGGYSSSDMGYEKSENSKGGNDYWIVKLDSLGNKQWDKTYGGSGDDKLVCVAEFRQINTFYTAPPTRPDSGDKDGRYRWRQRQIRFLGDPAGKALDSTGGTDYRFPPPDTTIAKGNYNLNVIPNPAHDKLTSSSVLPTTKPCLLCCTVMMVKK